MDRIPAPLNESSKDFADIKAKWFETARDIKLEDLPAFLDTLLNEYQHDYGTIVHAMTAGAIATAWAMNSHKQGGITGFQAGCLMWEFIRRWNFESNECGLKIVDYDNMLYPQYDHEYTKTISTDVWENLQKVARTKINEFNDAYAKYVVDVEQYEKDIAEFQRNHPDYKYRREHYDHLVIGTGPEWDAYEQKKAEGFKFAPREPADPRPAKAVMDHWISIVNGTIPFGYTVKAE